MQIYDYVMSGILYLISGVMFWQLAALKEFDSKIMPFFVALLLAVCATVLIIQKLCGKSIKSYDFSGSGRAAILGGITLVFIYMTGLFGFYACVPFYIIIMMLFLGQRSKKVLCIVPLATTACLYLMFHVFFSMSMPRGNMLDVLSYLHL